MHTHTHTHRKWSSESGHKNEASNSIVSSRENTYIRTSRANKLIFPFHEFQAMDTCSMEVEAAILCSLDQQLSLLAALLAALLIATIVTFAVAATAGCKGLRQKRERAQVSVECPAEESSKERGEMVLPISTTSSHTVQSDISHFSRELAMVKYCTSVTTTMPVQRVATDKGELVANYM